MISALHLLWIIPTAVCVGIFTAALLFCAADKSSDSDEVKKHLMNEVREGSRGGL